jgi:hypothetical protein
MAQSNSDRTARTEKAQRATLNSPIDYSRRQRPAESAAGIRSSRSAYKTLVSIERRQPRLLRRGIKGSAHDASNVLIAKSKSSLNTGVYKTSGF